MKRINKLLLVFAGLLVSFVACKDEDLQVVPDWETGVHTDITVPAGAQDNFFYRNAAPVTVDFLWNSIDSKNTVTKIEFYVQFNEPYVDLDGNDKLAKHGGSSGVLIKTLEGAAVPANRTKTQITFSQAEVFALYQNATFNYDGDATTPETPVFNNPAHPDRVADGHFVEADEFQLKWKVYTEDGRIFDSWSPSVCNEFPNAACQFDWVVVCPFTSINVFTGNYSCNEPGYGDYDVTFALKAGNTVTNDNFWDVGSAIDYVIDPATGKVAVATGASFVYSGTTYLLSGSGTINNCNGDMIVKYTITTTAGAPVETNTHTFTHK
jgi:hypothetical protein